MPADRTDCYMSMHYVLSDLKSRNRQVGFRGNNTSGGRIALLLGALCFQSDQDQLGHSSSTLHFAVACALRKACFRQARVARPCFHQLHCLIVAVLAILPCTPNPTSVSSHLCWGFPILRLILAMKAGFLL